MQETYTSDFPGMKHRQNIRPQYIMTSSVAGSNNQLSTFHSLSPLLVCGSLICLSPILSLLFCLSSCRGCGIILNGKALSNMEPVSAAKWGRLPGDRMARWVWFVRPSQTSEGVTCITAPLRERLCHVYCHVPRYATWLQTHQTHLQEYWYWECRGESHWRYSWKHTHTHTLDKTLP